MCGSALLYWHYCMRHVVAQQKLCLYAHWWRCMLWYLPYVCILMRMYVYVCQIADVMLLWCAGVIVIKMAILIFYLLCAMPGMALNSEMSCWSCCKFNCICAVAHNSLLIATSMLITHACDNAQHWYDVIGWFCCRYLYGNQISVIPSNAWTGLSGLQTL